MKNLIKIPHYRMLAPLLFATLISALGFALVVTNLDPYVSTGLGLSLFFISGFFLLTGLFTCIFFFIKKWRAQDHVYMKHVSISLRQGVFLSLLVNICIGLLILGLLRVWNGFLVVGLILFVEYHFSARDELD